MREKRQRPQNKKNGPARARALAALAAMRRGASISQAARENGVTPRTIKRYAGSALRQDRPGGRIRAIKSDHLTRYLQIPGPDGPIEISVRGSKAASEVARYKADVNRFLRGDEKALTKWNGKNIAGIELLTSPTAIKNLAERDLVPYALYRSFNGGAS